MIDSLFDSQPDMTTVRKMFDEHCFPRLRKSVMESTWISEFTESNPFLTKVSIEFWADVDIELRLNFYKGKEPDENIHDHRWSFYSMIIAGTMEHTRYARSNGAFQKIRSDKFESGDLYVVTEHEFHSVTASSDLVTLLVRGPYVKDHWKKFDPAGTLLETFRSTSKRSEQVPISRRIVTSCFHQIPQELLNTD